MAQADEADWSEGSSFIKALVTLIEKYSSHYGNGSTEALSYVWRRLHKQYPPGTEVDLRGKRFKNLVRWRVKSFYRQRSEVSEYKSSACSLDSWSKGLLDDPSHSIINAEEQLRLESELKRFGEQEANLIRAKFDPADRHKVAEVAQTLGVSRQKVKRIQAIAFERLKRRCNQASFVRTLL